MCAANRRWRYKWNKKLSLDRGKPEDIEQKIELKDEIFCIVRDSRIKLSRTRLSEDDFMFDESSSYRTIRKWQEKWIVASFSLDGRCTNAQSFLSVEGAREALQRLKPGRWEQLR